MLKIKEKIKFKHTENLMRQEGDIVKSITDIDKNKNLYMLLKERFDWMNNFINPNDNGIEVGAAAGFSKKFIKNKNFKISDFANLDHLDYKNVDAQDTGFENDKFDFVIASNMIHHLPFPLKFFNEMYRILKKGGRLIIFDAHCSLLLQIVLILMKHEGFDFTKNVWDEKDPKSDEKNVWAGNIAVPHLIFDNRQEFKKNLGSLFSIEFEKLSECFIFLNSGGVTSKTFCIPLPLFLLKILHLLDKTLIKLFPKIFCMGRKIVLKKQFKS